MGNGLKIGIFKYPASAATPWKVDVPASKAGGRRIRKFFASYSDAEKWIDEYSRTVFESGVESARDSSGVTVATAMRYYMDVKLEEASERQEETLKLMKRRIEDEFKTTQLDHLTVKRVDDWLNSSGLAKRTRYNTFCYLRTFLRWCHRRGYVKKVHIENLSEEIRKPNAPIETITAAEMRVLLHVTKRNPEMRALIVLGGFAGVRTDEVRKMSWECLDFENKEIHVPPHAIKSTEARGGARERYVAMNDAFLRHIPRGQKGPIASTSSASAFVRCRSRLLKRIRKILKRTGFKDWKRWESWPDNCTRHTFASCLLAIQKDAWHVAHQLGHSNTKTIYQHYARAVKERDAEEYFSL